MPKLFVSPAENPYEVVYVMGDIVALEVDDVALASSVARPVSPAKFSEEKKFPIAADVKE